MTSSRRRLLYLSNSYPLTVSGVTTVVKNLLTWMSPYHEVAVICPHQTTRSSKKVLAGVTHYFLPSYPTLIRKDVRFITPNPLQLQKVYDDFKPDLIHLHDPSPASIILRDLALKDGVPVIVSHHFTPQMVLGYLPESLKSLAQSSHSLNKAILQLACKIYEKVDRIVVPTETIKKSLSPLTHVPLSVISSGIDLDSFDIINPDLVNQFAARYQLPTKPFVLYAGRLDPEKNIEVLLRAWSRITSNNNKYHLVIAGDGGSLSKLKKLSRELKLSRSLSWLGLVPPHELPLLYANPYARAFAIPSPIESQSIVTLIALAAGLPVVAADAGALPEIVIDGHNGSLCPPNNPSCFAKQIVRLLENEQLSKELGAQGRALATHHAFPYVIKQYLSLYAKA